MYCSIFLRSGTDLTSLLILLLLSLLLLGQPLQKNLRLRHFKSDQDEIWQNCSSSKYVSIDGVRFLYQVIFSRWWPWRYLTQQIAVTCWVNVKQWSSSARQFPIYSTFILVYLLTSTLIASYNLYDGHLLVQWVSCSSCMQYFVVLYP